MKLTGHLPDTVVSLVLIGDDFSFDVQWIFVFLFLEKVLSSEIQKELHLSLIRVSPRRSFESLMV